MMSKVRWLMIILCITSAGTVSLSQLRYDAHFVMGYWSGGGTYNDPIIHFDKDKVNLDYQQLKIGSIVASSNISDQDGNLLFYFNGCDLANYRHEIIENGTGFNPGQIATRNCPSNLGYTSVYQSFLTLPLDDMNQEFIIFHHTKDYIFANNEITFYGIPRYSIVDMKANGGKGKVTLKNQIYLQDTTLDGGKLTAIKHANKKDWWIILLDNEGSNKYYKVLLKDGKVIPFDSQEIGFIWNNAGGGQAGFSSDGNKYFRYTATDGLSLMDFDRETGLFSNYRHFPTKQEYLFGGANFSPNGRFVYISHGPSLVQIDTEDAVMVADTVAIWDGTASDWCQPAWFGYMQTGPDCRIYMTTGFCIPFLHVIMEPDKKGVACDVRQHMIELEVPTCNLPYFPNYRLGTSLPYCNPDIVVLSSTNESPIPISNPKTLNIYPNPATDIVTVYGANMQHITIYDTQGNIMMQKEVQGRTSDDMDIAHLAPGVYMLKVAYGPAQDTKTLKLIKIK